MEWKRSFRYKKTKLSKREQAALKLIAWLNENDAYHGGYFDMGELGVLELTWSGSWQSRWIHVQPNPLEKK